MAGLENLLISPYLKRRIRRRVIRDYQAGEHKNPSHPFTIAPTNVDRSVILWGEDYYLKVSTTLRLRCVV